MTGVLLMPVRKVTISIDEELLARFERLASQDGQTRSEAIAASMQLAIKQRLLRMAVETGLAEAGGPTTLAEKSAARKRLGLTRR
ncbi:MAG: hypothetical protein RLZZ450_5089 [Pseudomonadota bacterium]|jgi:predicted transcriptional regulator